MLAFAPPKQTQRQKEGLDKKNQPKTENQNSLPRPSILSSLAMTHPSMKECKKTVNQKQPPPPPPLYNNKKEGVW
jgi:hypothetical protein